MNVPSPVLSNFSFSGAEGTSSIGLFPELPPDGAETEIISRSIKKLLSLLQDVVSGAVS
jgi:hypothetical protein